MSNTIAVPAPGVPRLVLAALLATLLSLGLHPYLVPGASARQSSAGETAEGIEIRVEGDDPVVTAALPSAASGGLVAPKTGVVATLTFAADQWQGGFYRGDSGSYGRPWTAIYGAQSRYPQATIAFSLDQAPTDRVSLTLVGLNDELGQKNSIRITVNGSTIFSGPSWFANWSGQGDSADAPWTTVLITMPASFFVIGDNQISIANLRTGDNFNEPPYVLLGAARLEAPGVGGSIPPSSVQVQVLPGR